MCAGAMRGWEKKLAETNRARELNAGYFMQRLPTFQRRKTPFLRLPALAASRAARDQVHALSARRGLGISTLYPAALNNVPELRQQFRGRKFPAASEASEKMLCLPTHEGLEELDRRAIVALIGSRLGGGAPRGQDTIPSGQASGERVGM